MTEPTTESGIGIWSDKLFVFKPLEDGDEPSASHKTASTDPTRLIVSEFFIEYHLLAAAIDALYDKRDEFANLVAYTSFAPLEQDEVPLSPAKL